MKKQNNNEMNNNTGVNETKPTKKKMKGSTIVIIVLVVLLLFSCVGNMGGSGSSSSSTTSTTTTEDKEPEDKKEEVKAKEPKEDSEPEAEKAIEEQHDKQSEVTEQVDNGHIYVGDTVKYSNCSIYVGDTGITSGYLNTPVLFMELEIVNTSDEVLTILTDNFSLYVDDYQIETMAGARTLEESASVPGIEINPGRKAKYSCVIDLPSDCDNASKIEVEFPLAAGIMLFKDNGVYLYGQRNVPTEEYDSADNSEESGLYESWYEEEHHNMDGLDYVLIFNHTTGGADADVILRADYDHQWRLWMEDERSGYLTYMEGNDKVGSIYFSSDGIEFKNDAFPELNGYYW